MSFHEVVICEIERDRSLKVFQLFAESIRESSKTAAVHPERVILLFDVRRGNTVNIAFREHLTIYDYVIKCFYV